MLTWAWPTFQTHILEWEPNTTETTLVSINTDVKFPWNPELRQFPEDGCKRRLAEAACRKCAVTQLTGRKTS